ncbi:MAG TPA: lasso peptide biosynthesis B2 protein [Solirubrobacteraceae bacterium]|jgi:hypothetical protein
MTPLIEPPGVRDHHPHACSGWREEPLSNIQRARLAVEIVAAYVRARRSLRRAPIAAAIAGLRSDGEAPSDRVCADRLTQARRLGRAVTRTLAFMPGDTRCLARSLVLTRLLAQRGIPAKLVIGARADPDFLAHAWVEYEGEPVLAPGDGSFGRLVEL